jgi:hypothetical protein
MNTAIHLTPDIAAAETTCPDCGGQMTIQLVQPHPIRPTWKGIRSSAREGLHVADSGSPLTFCHRRLLVSLWHQLGSPFVRRLARGVS